MNVIRFLMGGALVLALSACGGGGGNPGSTPNTNNPDVTPPAAASAKLVVELFNASGVKTANVTPGGGQTVRVTVTDAAGAPVREKGVTMSVEPASLATLAQSSVLTDDQGVASVAISPSSISTAGAGVIEAESNVNGVRVNGTIDFAVQAANLALSELVLSNNNLPSAGVASISVGVLQNGQPALGIPVGVNFSAGCGRINEQSASGGASNSSGVSVPTDGNGRALVTYRAVNMDGTLCRGVVNINATTTGVALPRTASLNVADPAVNAMTFTGALPSQIFVAESGAQERSLVTFRALANDSPIADQDVTFSIVVNPGGVGLNVSGNLSPVTRKTDSNGEVTISVFSGTIPGPVKVRASLTNNSAVFSETQNLTVASGPASQRFMSLSAEKFNIEGWNVDGSSTQLTVRLADRQGNPVVNGTVVNFVAEGGQIQPSCATQLVDGISLCSVNFVSQNPRPSDGRVSVLAFVSGTKDYEDLNQNNHFDLGSDDLYKIGDAYRDDNENGLYDSNEFVIPRGGTESCANTGAPFPSRVNTCDSLLGTTVRQQTTIMFSSSSPNFVTTGVSTSAVNFRLSSANNILLPMPVGTTIAAEAIDSTNNSLSCSVQRVFGTPVPNVDPTNSPTSDLATSHSVSLKDCVSGDSVGITVQSPSGLARTFFVALPSTVTPPVTPSAPDNITSDAPSPSQIFVGGNGLQEQATAVFRVRSGTTAVGSGVRLKISVVNNVGGVQIGERGKTAPVEALTDANGVVSVSVFSGTIPTPVKLRAELVSDSTVFVETQNLSIASGPPSQRFMSVSATRINILGADVDGDTTEITVRVADRQGNSVPDGTVINFIAEGGQVGSTCTTVTVNKISKCSVIFETQNPRPADGRVSVLVYTEGTKDYIDLNGNNRFDSADTLINIGDAYRDDNEDNIYNPGESVITRGATGGTCTTSSGAPFPARENTCDSTLKTTVRQQIVLLFADSRAQFTILNANKTDISLRLNSFGFPLLPMGEGTLLSAESQNPACSVEEVFPSTVDSILSVGINPAAQLGSTHNIRLTCTSGSAAQTVRIRLLATSRNGVVSALEVPVTVPAAP